MKVSSDFTVSPVRFLLLSVTLSVLICSRSTEAARILGLFAMPAPSHLMVFQALMKALAERGHVVEVASPHRLSASNPPNYTDIIIPTPETDLKEFLKHLVSPENRPWNEHAALWKFASPICETQLASPELKKYLSYNASDPSSKKFDLVVVEMFFVDCLLGFAPHFNAPLVAMVSQYSIPWANDAVGNPHTLSHVPNWFLPFGRKMTFFERLYNAFFTYGVSLYRRYVALPAQNEIATRYFGSEMPPLWEIERNISLVLLNGHPVLSPIHPSVPNMVDVGGMHILANPLPLPKDLQDLLDNNKRVVLFSLGSAIDAQTINQERLGMILSALHEIPCQVLWRWGSRMDHTKLPPNVHAANWLPQQSILAHPHLAAFVTHGGLLSLQESVYHAVPIVGFPFFGDQYMNLRHVEEAGLGIKLNFRTFTKEELVESITKLLEDESYSKAARRLSAVFRDQPQTPIERGVYWIEHLLRHNGAPHLRSGAVHLSWVQYHLLDIILFICISLVFVMCILHVIYSKLRSLMVPKRKAKKE